MDIEGFESFQDPNMIKTAPKKQGRVPAAFEPAAGGYSESTEGGFCYGPECLEDEEEFQPSENSNNLLDYITE